jgi:hypothetical protein
LFDTTNYSPSQIIPVPHPVSDQTQSNTELALECTRYAIGQRVPA